MPVGQYSNADVASAPPGIGQYSDADLAPAKVNLPANDDNKDTRGFFQSAVDQLKGIPTAFQEWWNGGKGQFGAMGDALHVLHQIDQEAAADPANKGKPPAQWKRRDLTPQEQAIVDQGSAKALGAVANPQGNIMTDVGGPAMTAWKQASEGNLLGAAGTLVGGYGAPAVAGKLLSVAPEVATATKGAAKGAYEGATGTSQVNYRGLKATVPDVITGGVGGGMAASAMGLPKELGVAAGVAAPVVVGAVRGALSELAKRRAALQDAAAAVANAQQHVATTIKAIAAAPESAAPAAPEPLPPERQLPAPSAPPPIIAGPITPTEIPNPPATPETNYPPTAPASASAAQPAPPVPITPAGTPELVSLDDIAKGLGPGIKSFKDLSARQQAAAQQIYDEIHGASAPAATAPVETPTSPAPATAQSPIGESAAQSPAIPTPAPVDGAPAPSETPTSAAPDVQPETPEPTTTAPKKTGFDELNAQISADLAKRKPPSVPVSTPEDASDAAKILFRDGSVAHLTPEQTQALHDYLSGPQEVPGQPPKVANPIPTAYRSKSASGLQIPQEASARDAIAQTAAEHLYKTGISPAAIRELTPDAQKLFWDNLSQLEGLSEQAHYSMSPQTIDATMGKLVKMSQGGSVAPPAPAAPTVMINGKSVNGMTAQQIAEALAAEIVK